VTQTIPQPASNSIRQAAEAILTRYPAAPASETEAAIAVLALWTLEAVEAGRLSPQDADQVFTLLDVEIGEMPGGPELSEDAAQLMLEGMSLHDWGTEWSADPGRMRSLALSILHAAS
jgi:hypothetical protein